MPLVQVSKAFLCLSVLLVTAIVPVRGLERDIDPALAVHGEDLAPAEAEPAQEPSKADLFFERAIDIRWDWYCMQTSPELFENDHSLLTVHVSLSSCRDSRNPSDKELRRSVELLYAAAGIEHLSIGKPNRTDSATIDSGEEPDRAAGQGGYLTAADVKVRWRNGSIQHEGAVRELIFVFREGESQRKNALTIA